MVVMLAWVVELLKYGKNHVPEQVYYAGAEPVMYVGKAWDRTMLVAGTFSGNPTLERFRNRWKLFSHSG